jgi:hypothetical protein
MIFFSFVEEFPHNVIRKFAFYAKQTVLGTKILWHTVWIGVLNPNY